MTSPTARRARCLAAAVVTASVTLAGTLSAATATDGADGAVSPSSASPSSASPSVTPEWARGLFEDDERARLVGGEAPVLRSTPVAASRPQGPAKIKTRVTAKEVGVTAPVDIVGKAPGTKRKIVLEQKTKRGWQAVKSKKTKKSGKFKLQVDTSWYGKRKLRVFAPRTRRKPAGTSKTISVKVLPLYAPAGSKKKYNFFPLKPRFNPCKTINYKVNPTGGPANAIDLVAGTLAQVHLATGLDFRYAGTTNAIPFRTDNGPEYAGNAGLTISWGDVGTVPGLAGGVAGLGGPVYYRPGRGAPARIAKAGVALDSGFVPTPAVPADNVYYLLLLHEVGHAMGMAHVNDPIQIMNPFFTGLNPTIYQAGDLTGLRKLGESQGCF